MSAAIRVEVGLDGEALAMPPPRAALQPCRDPECFSALIRARADAHKTVILAMTNAGFAPFWHNLRCSMDRHNVSRHAIIIGTDDAACDAAASASVPCVVGSQLLWDAETRSPTSLSQSAERHGTVEYARLMHIKARPALAVLRMGYNLLFTDTDMVWLRDPLHELRSDYGTALERGDVDVLIQSDYDDSNEAACTHHHDCARSSWCGHERAACEDEACGGFYYLRAATPAISMLEALFERMEWQRTHIDARLGEQPALNFVLRRTAGLRYTVLPRQDYPNGNAFFVRHPPRSMPVIVHNNWLAGYEAKRERFVQHGLWLLDEGGAACVDAALAPPQRGRPKTYRR